MAACVLLLLALVLTSSSDLGAAGAAGQPATPPPTARSGNPVDGSSAPSPVPSPALSPVPSPVPSPAPSPVPSSVPSDPTAEAPAAEGMVLSVPALGLSADVAEIDPVDGTIDPPTFDRAYRIAPYGTPGSDNTTYIAGHSWNAGDAVFNPLIDVASQQATLAPGDVVDVVADGVTFSYEVVSTARYPKGTLAEVDEVWQKVPGRLVLITCFQLNTGARSRDNLVVTAQLVEPGPATVQPGTGA